MNSNIGDLGFSLILFIILSGISVWIISNTRSQIETVKHQIKLFIVSITVRYVSAILFYVLGLSALVGDEDSSGYYIGLYYYGLWKLKGYDVFDLPSIWMTSFSLRHQGYYFLAGTYYFLTDYDGRMGLAVINCLFGALTAVLSYRIARILYSNWTAVRVGWAICFIPSMIIWSCQTLKEPVVIFLETLALYACVKLRQGKFSIKYIIVCVVIALVIYPFRFYASLVTGVAIMVTLILPSFSNRRGSSIVPGLIVIALVLSLASSSGMLARSEAEISAMDIERIQQFRANVALEGSGVENTFDMTTTTGFALATIVGGLHLALAPFPWQIRFSPRILLTLPEMLYWWWIFFAGLIPGLIYIAKTRLFDFLPMMIFIAALGFLYSMMFGNIGLIFRQRAQLMPWLLIFCMIGLEIKAVKKYLKKQSSSHLQHSQGIRV